jgi:hypothetical protein
MKLPKKVTVGAYTFKIKRWSQEMTQDKDAYGQFLPRQMYIGLDPNLTGTLLLDTLIHEINHCVFFAYNIHDKDEEERTVHTISTAWTQIYRDNPRLLKFIAKTV